MEFFNCYRLLLKPKPILKQSLCNNRSSVLLMLLVFILLVICNEASSPHFRKKPCHHMADNHLDDKHLEYSFIPFMSASLQFIDSFDSPTINMELTDELNNDARELALPLVNQLDDWIEMMKIEDKDEFHNSIQIILPIDMNENSTENVNMNDIPLLFSQNFKISKEEKNIKATENKEINKFSGRDFFMRNNKKNANIPNLLSLLDNITHPNKSSKYPSKTSHVEEIGNPQIKVQSKELLISPSNVHTSKKEPTLFSDPRELRDKPNKLTLRNLVKKTKSHNNLVTTNPSEMLFAKNLSELIN